MYKIEVDAGDVQFIHASILHNVRKAHEVMPEDDAIKFTTACAEVVSRLNEGRLDTNDVMLINICIQKVKDALGLDNILSKDQKRIAIDTATSIQNKLAGMGIARTLFRP